MKELKPCPICGRSTRTGTVVDVRGGEAVVMLDDGLEVSCRTSFACEAGDRVVVAAPHQPSVSTVEGGE